MKKQQTYMTSHRAWKRSAIATWKLDHGCVDCGYNENPHALQFDHRDPGIKVMAVANMISRVRPIDVIVDEMEKCDVRCANCHAIKTHRRVDA